MRKKIYHERFELRLTRELYRDAKNYADSEGLTVSQLIRDLLRHRLKIEAISKTLK